MSVSELGFTRESTHVVTIDMYVDVLDQNDISPIFYRDEYRTSVREQPDNGTLIQASLLFS